MVTGWTARAIFGRVAVGLFCLSGAMAATEPMPSPQPSAAPTPPPIVSFSSTPGRLWLNHTEVIPVTIGNAAKDKYVAATAASPQGTVEILQPATFLKGEKTGFLRVRGLKAGKVSLNVGGWSFSLEVAPDPAEPVLAPRPQIVSPPEGACLYGTITAGVEIDLPDGQTAAPEPKLVLANGQELTPRAQTLDPKGQVRLYAFDIDADSLPPGPQRLQTYMVDAAGRRTSGAPVAVNVIRPDPSAMISGACAERVNDPRPQRFGEKPPEVKTDDPFAPEGYVANTRPDPAWCFKETLEKAGYYQLTMRVKGDASAGSYPSIGLILGEQDRPLVASRLVDNTWRRIPVGRPIHLDAGEQTIVTRFVNDFSYGKKVNRNLYLERYELVRVAEDASASTADSGDDSSMMMSDGAPDMMMTMMASNPGGPPTGAESLRVSFASALEGRRVQGPLTIRAQTWRPKNCPPPTVDLLVNGRSVGSQEGREIVFRVPVTQLREGSNVLQLRARTDSGLLASSTPESVFLDQKPPKDAPTPEVLRYTAEDRNWDPGMPRRVDTKGPPAAAFFTNGEALLTLPSGLKGNFTVKLEARGTEDKGPPVVEALLKTGSGEPQKIGQVSPSGDFRTLSCGKATLAEGPKQIVLRYGNDLADKDGDRNWWLKALTLESSTPASNQPPQLQVLYPRLTSAPLSICGVGAIVADVFAPDGIDWVDLVVDGKPRNLRFHDSDGLGQVVLPVVAGGLAPGEHRMRLLAHGSNGQETLSADMPLRVVSDLTQADRGYIRAIHLLNRFGYGPEPEELAAILTMGEKAWLRDRLTRPWNDPAEQAAIQRAWNQFPDRTEKGQVVARVLSYLMRSPNPVRNRFVMWTENHFSTWLQKADALNKWPEHERFMELGAAPFGDLLMASATSPAMLVYLDQNRSFANKLNENYAREVMELHTLGVHGGYRQEDVTNLASILTGWTFSTEAPLEGPARDMVRVFRYEPGLNSPKEKIVFGLEFPKAEDPEARYDRTRMALEMLASHPSTATFISRKLAEHYVSVPAPDALVKRLAARFIQTGGDMAEMLLAIADSPEFWASMDRPRIATPLDYSLRISRMIGGSDVGQVNNFLRKSGMGLFDRSTPDGYPDADGAYADSNALLQRWRFTTTITEGLRKLVPPSMIPAPNVPWTPAAQAEAVAYVAARLNGMPLAKASQEAALQYLTQASTTDPDRSKLVTSFVAQLPQTSLR